MTGKTLNSVRSLTVGLLFAPILTCSAQYAWFARNTDVISVSGQTDLGTQCTIEVILMLPSSAHSGGSVFDEWVLNQEEKHLDVSMISVDGVAFPNDPLEASENRGLVTLDQWHHIAYVCDGVEQRLYLDGQLIQSAPGSATLGNGSGPAFVGYAPRAGSDLPSFVGLIDTLRVSKLARYSGPSFTPPTGDLLTDPETVLLYNFNDPPDSTAVKDESPLGRTGTLGTGFSGATSPKLVAKLPDAVPLGLQIFTAVELQFSTSIGGQYQIESSPDMAVWTPLPGMISGLGGITNKLLSTRETGKLFYRVVARP
jgi:hypothetical protein